MSEVTRILSSNEHGDPSATEQLLSLVYEELRKLAAQRLARDKPGQSLPGTTLVRKAYQGLVVMERGRHGGGLARRGHQDEQPAEVARGPERGGPSGLTSPRESSRRRPGTAAARSRSTQAIFTDILAASSTALSAGNALPEKTYET
jgi:hypothetical protein